MIYRVGTICLNEDGSSRYNVQKTITKEEVENLMNAFNSLKPIKDAYKRFDIFKENGCVLERHLLNPLPINKSTYKKEIEAYIDRANKLIYNFCSSFGTLLDFYTRKLPDNVLKSHSHQLFNNNFEYRFFARLRNYLVHYDFPFTEYVLNYTESRIVCNKQHLQAFKSWGADVNSDFKKIGDEIDIAPLIQPFMSLVSTYYFVLMGELCENLVETFEIVGSFLKKYSREALYILVAESDIQLEQGEFTIYPLDVDFLNKVRVDIENNPLIDIKLK